MLPVRVKCKIRCLAHGRCWLMVAIVIRSLFHGYIDQPCKILPPSGNTHSIISDYLSGCSAWPYTQLIPSKEKPWLKSFDSEHFENYKWNSADSKLITSQIQNSLIMMRENICQVEFNLFISQTSLFGKDSCYRWYPKILYPGVCKAVPKRVFMHIVCM